MADEERTPQAARMSPPDALMLPHVIEAIATCSINQEDFESFLRAVPRSLWTPALVAFLDCHTEKPSTVSVNWPRIKLTDVELSPSVLTLLAAMLPLRPRMVLRRTDWDAASLASLIAVLGPALSDVTLLFSSNRTVNGQGHAISNLFLQRCPRLRRVVICEEPTTAAEIIELNDLLAVAAHPHVEDMTINLRRATATPRLGHLLATWLLTAPSRELLLENATALDHDGVIAFCDALQANTTLTNLSIRNASALGGFHGRTLPVSLKTLTWNVRFNRVINVVTLTDLATAVGPTHLEQFDCNVFCWLATCPAAAPMLAQLQMLTVSSLDVGDITSLLAGLSSVPVLISLTLRNCNLSSSTRLLMKTLATTCVHLVRLDVSDHDLTRDDASAVIIGVTRLLQLTSLTLSMRLSDVLHILPALIAAGRHLRDLTLTAAWSDADDDADDILNLGMRAIFRALAQVHDVPFVAATLPKNMDQFVIDALGPRADRCHQCELHCTRDTAGRPTPPHAVTLPHVIEAIATILSSHQDLESFLVAVPRSLWTPALTAFLDVPTAMPSMVRAEWPRIVLASMDLPLSVLALLVATLPLRPHIEIERRIRDAAPLASLVANLGPSLSSVILDFNSDSLVDGQGRAISDLFLQRCPRLRRVTIRALSILENKLIELNNLLAVVAHPFVQELFIDLQYVTATPRLGHLLASWLSTAPATKLRVINVAQMDHDGAIALCDALQANSTLRKLSIDDVPNLGGFHGRMLPATLKWLKYNAFFNRVVDDATVTDLATAIGHTHLNHLECNVFGQLATCPAAAPMLSRLRSLCVNQVADDAMQRAIAGLSSVPALSSLDI
ncbi:hypothetical protein SDRG_09714 [Saprolegnia diclina VS20]|uniref:Uncharacterized protein n=1 Tax=Saprolegnia diclina (strain VS20) TaxID=1156394 RepID=T0RRJ2_SAPDV|nr:hypothetical protein SDRG_09714 [Saprolegnia diclina VS20]EQC32742.1 hypothetical protein SDRG_09714 [Saprolegnia diclina VS20]|eukprot:XP_008613886.1 hypothetical protein SDRG_09714 [Saprolegnia diclina VS20]